MVEELKACNIVLCGHVEEQVVRWASDQLPQCLTRRSELISYVEDLLWGSGEFVDTDRTSAWKEWKCIGGS